MELLLIGLLVFIGLCLYFLPAIVAEQRRHHNALAIFWLNFFLGWSLLGWIISLVWACTVVKYDNGDDLDKGLSTSRKCKSIPTLKSIILITLLVVIAVFLYNYKYPANSSGANNNIAPPIPSNPNVESSNEIGTNLENQPFQTIYGVLTAVKDDKYQSHIFLDNNEIMSSYTAIVNNEMHISDHEILVIITDPGGSIGNTSYSIVDIKPDKSVIVKDVVNGWDGTDFFQSGKCINAKTHDLRPYADKADYTLFTYCIDGGGEPYDEYKFAKPDSYYSNKFSTYTSKQIYDIAVSDDCFDIDSNQLNMSNVCYNGQKYCFMFNSKVQKENDYYTQILENACSLQN